MAKNKEKNKAIKIFFVLVFIGISCYIIYTMYQKIEITDQNEYDSAKLSTNYTQNVNNWVDETESKADMLEKVIKSVVGISKLTNTGGSILNNVSSDNLGLGTGIIVSEDGYILSNSHVTGEKYSNCYITVDENTYEGSVVWSDAKLDLSIVKISANNLTCIELGDSSNIRIGDDVFAIGNPIGYEFKRTVTSGIISALNRTIKVDENNNTSYISDLIQTDATINPGNSGGPLVNRQGDVVGINTVKITSAEGIGFAIPINVIKPVIEAFKQNGTFEEATLGIYGYDGDVATYLNLKGKINSGVYVSQILANGPSSQTELKEGDLITKIDGKNLKTINDLKEYIYKKKPGDSVDLEIIRKDSEKEISIILGKKQ